MDQWRHPYDKPHRLRPHAHRVCHIQRAADGLRPHPSNTPIPSPTPSPTEPVERAVFYPASDTHINSWYASTNYDASQYFTVRQGDVIAALAPLRRREPCGPRDSLRAAGAVRHQTQQQRSADHQRVSGASPLGGQASHVGRRPARVWPGIALGVTAKASIVMHAEQPRSWPTR